MQNNNHKPQNNPQRINILPPEPVLRSITINTGIKKWKGCIYLSSYDLTGQMISYLKNTTSAETGMYLKNPVYIFVAASKSELDSKLLSKIKTLTRRIKTHMVEPELSDNQAELFAQVALDQL
jgi:hypothetical protein